VVVREDVAVLRDDEAGAARLLRLGAAWGASKLRKKSSMPGAPVRGRAARTRCVWIDTTLGVTWSAIASNALPVSASDRTSDDATLAAAEPCWAKPNRVRSKPEAKMRPQANAVTTAATYRARENLAVIPMNPS
jgi:hypothetical protein